MASESFPPSPCRDALSCRDILLVRVLFILIIYNTLLRIYLCFVKEQMTWTYSTFPLTAISP